MAALDILKTNETKINKLDVKILLTVNLQFVVMEATNNAL
jgi:hypothetical protein